MQVFIFLQSGCFALADIVTNKGKNSKFQLSLI
jgi:hypothetical protein